MIDLERRLVRVVHLDYFVSRSFVKRYSPQYPVAHCITQHPIFPFSISSCPSFRRCHSLIYVQKVSCSAKAKATERCLLVLVALSNNITRSWSFPTPLAPSSLFVSPISGCEAGCPDSRSADMMPAPLWGACVPGRYRQCGINPHKVR